MEYRVPGLTTGMAGDVGSGVVSGLKGYGVSNKLPTVAKKDSGKIDEEKSSLTGSAQLLK